MKVPKTDLIHKAKILSYFTILYNLLEGLISIFFGLEDESVSLLGFGLDSFIEVASATIVLLKIRSSDPDKNLLYEKRSVFSIGLLFILLSLSIGINSLFQLYTKQHPETTVAGILISTLSLSFMFYLWKSKMFVGKALNSSTIIADAKCSLACIKLSFILFAGSIIYFLAPQLWWADSIAAIILAVLIGKEGIEMIQNSRKEDFTGGCGCH